MNNIEIFEKLTREYDTWFDSHRFVYESEVLALKSLIPESGKGVEIGVGTGRFAVPLKVETGIEPAKAMADIARKRNIEVCRAKAERLPFKDESFDFTLFVTTICFLENPVQALREARRILKSKGYTIIGMIDKNSPLGKIYESKRTESRFYRHAHFYNAEQVLEWLRALRFGDLRYCQTIFKDPEEISATEPVENGHGKGLFVAISGQKEDG